MWLEVYSVLKAESSQKYEFCESVFMLAKETLTMIILQLYRKEVRLM